MDSALTIHRTGPDDPRLEPLIRELDQFLLGMDGPELQGRVGPYNRLEPETKVLIAERDGAPVGCGAVRQRDARTAEIKRMYVRPEARGNQIGSLILKELETWAKELGHSRAILETVPYLTSAVKLYMGSGYQRIPNYPPYDKIPESICFEKILD